MRSVICSALLFVVCPAVMLTGCSASESGSAAQSLDGVWMIDEIVMGGGEDEGRHTSDVQPSLIFFTGSHYSTMYVRGWEPRPLLSEEPTDEERSAAYQAFVANAGRFAVDGSTITFTPSVAKNPGTMTDNSISRELEWDGDGLWMSFDSNAGDWQNRYHFVRVGD